MRLSTDGVALVQELLNEHECDDVARSLEELQAVGAGYGPKASASPLHAATRF